MRFFEELKRRKVIRVGVAYLVAAWLIAQVAELVAESFGAPDWFMRMLLVLLALGLPVALFMSWAFDLTPEGLVRDGDVTPAISRRASRLLSTVTVVLLMAALGYFFWESRWAEPQPGGEALSADAGTASERDPVSEPEIGNSIAVLPFENFSGDPADEYFADGLTDTLLHKLAQIDQLKVIARNSSFQFKGQNRDVREIGKILDVDIVLEGSVQRAGRQVRIIAQLIRTADGAHLWSSNFDDTMDNIFDLQDRVTSDIATQLQVDLTAEQRRRIMRDGTSNPQAYELLIRAINEKTDFDDMADVDDTEWPPVVLIRQALELDPGYAQAWSRLSFEYNFLGFATKNAEKFPHYVAEAERAAQKAIELAPELADGYNAMGWVAHRKGERLLAQQYFRRALAMEPDSMGAMSGLALQLGPTEPEEALRLLTRVHELEPTSVITHRQKHFALVRLGRHDEAIAELRAALEKDSGAGLIVKDLSDLLIEVKGRPDEAATVNAQYLRQNPASFEVLAAMVESWRWATGVEEAGQWARLMLAHHAESNEAWFSNVGRLVAAGRFDDALQELERVSETDGNRWQIVSGRARACLGSRQAECALQQSGLWKVEIAQERERGAAERSWDVLPLMTDILAAEMGRGGGDVTAQLAAVNELIASDPYFDVKYFLRAGVAARFGQTQQALSILDDSLSASAPGIYSLDLFGLTVEHSPLLDPLRGQAAFDDWLQRHLAQRGALLQRMRKMEALGEILSAASVARMLEATGPG